MSSNEHLIDPKVTSSGFPQKIGRNFADRQQSLDTRTFFEKFEKNANFDFPYKCGKGEGRGQKGTFEIRYERLASSRKKEKGRGETTQKVLNLFDLNSISSGYVCVAKNCAYITIWTLIGGRRS